MTMHKRLKKPLSLFLSLIMVLSLLPGMQLSLRAEEDDSPPVATDTDVDDPELLQKAPRDGSAPDYYLEFKDQGGGDGWLLYRQDTQAEYTGKNTTWSASGTTLTLKDGFSFAPEGVECGIHIADGGSLAVEDNATVSVTPASTASSAKAVSFAGNASTDAKVTIGEGADVTFSADTDGDSNFAYGIFSPGSLTVDIGSAAEVAVSASCKGTNAFASAMRGNGGTLNLTLADNAVVNVTAESPPNLATALHAEDATIDIGSGAELSATAKSDSSGASAYALYSTSGDIAITGSGKASFEAETNITSLSDKHYSAGIRAYSGSITLSDSVEVTATITNPSSQTVPFAGAHADVGLTLSDSAVLIASGTTEGIYSGAKPTGAAQIALSKDAAPSPLPTAQPYTVVDDGTSGITFNTTDKVFKIDSDKAKYVSLSAVQPTNYYLEFKDKGGGDGWQLYRQDTQDEYTGKDTTWSASGDILTLKDGFSFAPEGVKYGIHIANGGSLAVEDDATVSVTPSSSVSFTQAVFFAGSASTDAVVTIGEGAEATFSAATGVWDSGTAYADGIISMGSLTLTIGSDAEVAVSSSNEDPSAFAIGIRTFNGALDLTLADNAVLDVTAETASGSNVTSLQSSTDINIDIGSDAELNVTANTDGNNSADALFTSSGDIAFTGSGKANLEAETNFTTSFFDYLAAGIRAYDGSITLSGSVEVTATITNPSSDSVALAGAYVGGDITLSDSAVLTASGVTAGIYSGTKPTGATQIALSKDAAPSPLPTPQPYSVVDDGTSGITFNTTDKVFKIDSDKAKYVSLSAVQPTNYYLEFKDKGGGDGWLLYRQDTQAEYTGKDTTWSASSDTLTLKDGFSFAPEGVEYGILIANGGKLAVEDGATVSVTPSSSVSFTQAVFFAGSASTDAVVTIGEGAEATFSAATGVWDSGTAYAYGIISMGSLTLTIGSDAEVAVSSSNEDPSAFAIGIRTFNGALDLTLGDNAVLDVTTEATSGSAQSVYANTDATIDIGSGAELNVIATNEGAATADALYSASGDIAITGSGKASFVTEKEATSPTIGAYFNSGIRTANGSITLSGSVEVTATLTCSSPSVLPFAGVYADGDLTLSDSAVLTASGITDGIYSGNKPTGATQIALSKDAAPSPLPTAQPYTNVDNGTSGITFDTTDKVFKIDSDKAKYVSLKTAPVTDYYLEYKQVSGTWDLYIGGTSTPYAQQTARWTANGSTLLLKDEFEFDTTAEYALVFPQGGTLDVDANATATLKTVGTTDAQITLYANSSAFNINAGEGATLNVITDHTHNGSFAIYSDGGLLTLSGDGSIIGDSEGTSSYTSIGIQGDFGITLEDKVKVEAIGYQHGLYAADPGLVMKGQAVLIGRATGTGSVGAVYSNNGQAGNASLPAGPAKIAYSMDPKPSTAPSDLDYAKISTTGDNAVGNGLRFSDVLKIFESNEAGTNCKYIRLTADSPEDYYLRFTNADAGTWKLLKYDASDTLISEYTEQTSSFSINQNGTLTFIGDFTFRSGVKYGLWLDANTTLEIADGKTVTLTAASRQVFEGALRTDDGCTLDIGENALLNASVTTTDIAWVSAICSLGDLDIKGSGKVQATVNAPLDNTYATQRLALRVLGTLTLSESVLVVADSTEIGAVVDDVVLSGTAALVGKGVVGVAAGSSKPTQVASIAASVQKEPSPEPALRDYSIVDNNSDLTYMNGRYWVSGKVAQYVKLSAEPVKPTITTVSLHGGATTVAYTQTMTATGTAPITWADDGNLPPGLTMSSAGVISGTPTTAGDYAFSITATNTAGADTKQYTISIVETPVPPQITTVSLHGGVTGALYSQQMAATGTAPITWSAAGLPPGLSINPVTGVISGTPVGAATYSAIITATNVAGTVSHPYNIVIAAAPEPPVITTVSLPAGAVGTPYSQTMAATGTAPITWAVTNGTLPNGLSLNPATGVISGTPTRGGGRDIIITASNAAGTYSGQFIITIFSVPGGPTITTPSLPNGVVSTPYNQTLTAAGTAPITWSVIDGALPAGLFLNPATGVISGTPTMVETATFIIQAENIVASSQMRYTVTIAAAPIAPVITTPNLHNGVVGSSYSQTIGATGTAPITWSLASGTLPAGLTLNPVTGIISGTPASAGSSSFTVTATNLSGSDSKPFTITVDGASVPTVITTTSLANGTVGNAYSQTLTATGTAPIDWTVTQGALPAGLSINYYTGVISGTPTAAGTFTFTVQAFGWGGADTKQLTITVDANTAVPVITTTALNEGTVGTAYSQTLTATGDTPIKWTVASGTLPTGLTLNEDTGVISGTPTISSLMPLSIKATNSAGSDTKPFSIFIAPQATPPVIITSSFPDGAVGSAYTQPLMVLSATQPTLSMTSGALPDGLSLDTTMLAISGTPTVAGTFTFTLKAENSAGSDSRQFTIVVTANPVAPVITTTALPDGAIGAGYTEYLSATGTASMTWSVTEGALPAGLNMESDNGIIFGVPTAAGTYTFTLQVANSAGSDSKQFTLVIASAPIAPVITTTALSGGVTGTAYSQTMAATGTANIFWNLESGALPAGLTLNMITGVISGTPTAAGSYSFTVIASNAAGFDSKQFTIVVSSSATAPAITTTAIPGGVEGTAYSRTLTATGTAPITWAVTTGTLPAGLTLNPSTGVISGTPTTAGSYNFTITASNAAGADSHAFTLVINQNAGVAPVITTASLPNGTVNRSYSQTLRATGTMPIVWSVSSGILPNGLHLDMATGVISGTPTQTGTYRFTIEALNADGSDEKAFTIRVESSGGGGGGGGGTINPPIVTEPEPVDTDTGFPENDALVIIDGTTYDAGEVTVDEANNLTTTVVHQNVIDDKIKNAQKTVEVIIPAHTGNSAAELVVKNIEDMEARDITFSILAGNVTYQFHASAIDTAQIMQALGTTDSASAPITFNISTAVSEGDKALAEAAVTSRGGEIVFPPMSFSITASYGGETVTVNDFLKYVTRIVEVTPEQAQQITTAVVVEPDGTLRHVPTNVYQSGGKYYAAINSLTNSTYALIHNEQAFADAAGKWYEGNVNEMASRKIIAGVSHTAFAGDRNITRAEFAAIIVRALGIPETGNASSQFSDISPGSWYNGAVSAAHQYGIASGMPDGSFAPDAPITRQEAMVMVKNAAKITGLSASRGAAADASDQGKISTWAAEAAQFTMDSELIVGHNGEIRPLDHITRAETATIVLKLLQGSDLVDERGKR